MAKIQNKRKGDRHSPGYYQNFDRVNYDHINFKFRKDSGIMEALDLVSRKTGVSKVGYIRDAVVDRLIEDGYMPEK